jgi:ubiquinone/menaquinone biosynthesis C-methylase UbiE
MPGPAEDPAMEEPVDRLARQWSGGRRPRVYDFTVQHERFFRALSRVVWAADVRTFYRSLSSLAEVPAGSSILDVPCGGGVAFRGLKPDAPVRYVAADVSPIMLDHARVVARRLGLDQIEFVQTSVSTMPFADDTFDFCVCFNGLHCFDDPNAAIAELVRVLRPGGRLLGTVVVSDHGGLSSKAIRFFQRTDQFGSVPTEDGLRTWFADAGLQDVEVGREGAWASFSGRRKE